MYRILVLVVLLLCSQALAADGEATVLFSNAEPGVEQITFYDLTGQPIDQSQQTRDRVIDWLLIPGTVVQTTIVLPMKACDDAVDCAKAIKSSCEFVGSSAKKVNFLKKSKNPCEGECDNGVKVLVVCP